MIENLLQMVGEKVVHHPRHPQASQQEENMDPVIKSQCSDSISVLSCDPC
ncbi:hypothetical protein RchiOBHm_Chr5g0032831 [Rosa chinensis]|uniref:Uncharacterized protein n=1 Tax=Rosa chinensis TaxID=74649 RepID=A0A2P6QAJ0_ROSCH|nr:hypothetical protein RchiOBHm_Chr5g0032831 [Rosa chinensis]